MQSAEEMLRRLSDPDTKHQLDQLHQHANSNNVNVQEVTQVDKHRNCEQSPVKLDEKRGFGLRNENLRTKQSRDKQQHLASSQSNQKAN